MQCFELEKQKTLNDVILLMPCILFMRLLHVRLLTNAFILPIRLLAENY